MPVGTRDPTKLPPDRIGDLTREEWGDIMQRVDREIREQNPPRVRRTIYDLRPVPLMTTKVEED